MKPLFYVIVFTMLCPLMLWGQGSYSVFPNEAEYRLPNEIALEGELDDRLIYRFRRNNVFEIWISDGSADGTYMLQDGSYIEVTYKSDSIWYFNITLDNNEGRIASLEPGDQELTTVFEDTRQILPAHIWQGDLYFQRRIFQSTDRYLAKLDLETNFVTTLYTDDGLSIRSIGSSDDYIYFIASLPDGNFLGRTQGENSDVEVDMLLFPNTNTFSPYIFPMVSNGEGVYFFYHPDKETYNIYYMHDTMSFPTILDTAIVNSTRISAQFNDKYCFQVVQKKFIGFDSKLMITDGTLAGTSYATIDGDEDLSPTGFKVFKDRMYFHFNKAGNGLASIGADETEAVVELRPTGHTDGAIGNIRESVIYQDSLLVTNGITLDDAELYVCEGNEETLMLLSDVIEDDESDPSDLTVVGDRVFFIAGDSDLRQLYVYDPNYNVSVLDLASQKEINLYPNPTQGVIYLDEDVSNVYSQIQIVDQKGKIVAQQKLNQHSTVNLGQLIPGFYTAVFSGDGVAAHANIMIKK